MTLTDTASHYGPVTRALHWLTALLIFSAFPLGLLGHETAEQIAETSGTEQAALVARAATIFSIHKTIGVAAFFVALIRILWAVVQRRPGLIHGDRKPEALAAQTVHWVLYGAMLLAPLSGWLHHAATEGFAPILWPLGQSLPFVPVSAQAAALFGGIHWIAVWALAVTVALHVAGALKHHFIDRDATLLRMVRGAPATGSAAQPSHLPPLALATIILAAILVYGGLSGRPEASERAETADLAAVESGWTVTEGSLTLTVTQFGKAVEGSFADWTASIDYAEGAAEGPAGDLRVVISIPSMTLGSVTKQALGTDFLAADEHGQAVFEATLIRTAQGHTADGTLTLRGVAHPLSFPFTLRIDGDTAQAAGSFTLHRLDYGIGATMPGDDSVGLTVDVAFDLTTQRTE